MTATDNHTLLPSITSSAQATSKSYRSITMTHSLSHSLSQFTLAALIQKITAAAALNSLAADSHLHSGGGGERKRRRRRRGEEEEELEKKAEEDKEEE